MFFNNKFNTFFGLNLTLVYTFPMCMAWRFHFPIRNNDFKSWFNDVISFVFDTVRVPVFYLSENRTENRFQTPVHAVNRVPVHETTGHDNNTRAYSLDDTKRTVAFISNYADDHALVLPGRVPGFQRDDKSDIRLMPSCETKVKVHAAYTTAMSNLGMCNYWHISLSL